MMFSTTPVSMGTGISTDDRTTTESALEKTGMDSVDIFLGIPNFSDNARAPLFKPRALHARARAGIPGSRGFWTSEHCATRDPSSFRWEFLTFVLCNHKSSLCFTTVWNFPMLLVWKEAACMKKVNHQSLWLGNYAQDVRIQTEPVILSHKAEE